MAKKSNSTKREIWKPIAGYEGWYEVSNFGRVRRMRPEKNTFVGRILIPSGGGRYGAVGLSRDGVAKNRKVHIMVCETFHGPRPSPRHEAAHWDGDPGNNVATNLRWATPLENHGDRRRHGRTPQGERNIKAKLTADKVKEIRALERAHATDDIAARYGITGSTVRRIMRRVYWSHVD